MIVDLSALLRLADHCGIYHLPPGGQGGLPAAAEAANLQFVHCDLEEAASLEAALAVLGNCLGFPEWYGHNLDALHDCLTDFSWQPETGWAILLSGIDALRAAEPEAYDTLIEVLFAAASYWREQEVPFWVFLDMRADGLADLPTIS